MSRQEGGTEDGWVVGDEGEGGSKNAALVTCLQHPQVPGPVQWVPDDHDTLQAHPLVVKQMYTPNSWGTEEHEGIRKFEVVLEGCWGLDLQFICSLLDLKGARIPSPGEEGAGSGLLFIPFPGHSLSGLGTQQIAATVQDDGG